MPRQELTAETVSKLRTGPGRTAEWYFDTSKSATPGFCCKVTISGSRSFYLRYRWPRDSEKKVALFLGEAAHVPLDKARKLARAAHDLWKAGTDPRAERTRQQDEARRAD
jgi:hypothetical protein